MIQLKSTSMAGPREAKIGHVTHDDLFGRPELHGISMPFGRNAEIYGEGEPADYVYKVLSGSVRSYKVLGDGRRQIIGFHLSGDVFGLDCEAEHSCSAEAIADCQILLVRRTTLLNVAERDIDVARSLWTLTAMQLKRAREHSLLLIKTAQERLVAFLLDIARRPSASNEVELPMSRQDIADHLGLTIETVSRTFTQLSEASVIRFLASRRIVVRKPAMLAGMNG
jgi:CRP/FNR family transcriptional regulator, nitrogen fixation regulation protein